MWESRRFEDEGLKRRGIKILKMIHGDSPKGHKLIVSCILNERDYVLVSKLCNLVWFKYEAFFIFKNEKYLPTII